MICFTDARCCIKYRIRVLYNSLNKYTRYFKYQSHPPPKYAWWLSHPPLSIESPASRRKMRVLHEAVLARDDWPLLYDKLAMSNTYSHDKNHNDPCPITLSKVAFLESRFSAVAILGGGWLQSPTSDGPPWVNSRQNLLNSLTLEKIALIRDSHIHIHINIPSPVAFSFK